jgi:hypothetical protein
VYLEGALYVHEYSSSKRTKRRDIMHTPQEWDLTPISRCKVPPIVEE